MTDIEKRVMAHRYLYYIKCNPRIPDLDYDVIEREARAIAPPESPVHKLGSSLASSYSPEIVALAMSWVGR